MEEEHFYDAIARSHNEAYPQGSPVTGEDVRKELRSLLGIYGRFKNLREETSGTRSASVCSFCGKGSGQVAGIVAGQGTACICNECVEICREFFRRSN